MNYRHAFHAGSHTDVFKHSVLVLLLDHLLKKPAPFMVLDTHAGIGLYDLTAEEARRTGEAARGIGRVMDARLAAAQPYLDLVRSFNPEGLVTYPGSPAIVRAMLRAQDRLVACELHPEDVVALRRTFRGERRVEIHHRDGYEALGALLPPPERRGLVLIDPPFEAQGEFARLGAALVAAARKWPTGIYAAWYPVKDPSGPRALARQLAGGGLSAVLDCQMLPFAMDGERLAGSGMVIVNPPWQFDQVLKQLGRDWLTAFDAPTGRAAVTWLAPAKSDIKASEPEAAQAKTGSERD